MTRARRVIVCCGLVAALTGCRSEQREPVEERTAALTSRAVTLSVAVPRGTDAATMVLAANGSLVLGDRAVVAAPIANVGSGGTNVGADARAGAITSASTVTVRDRAVVSGAVNTTVPISSASSSTIVGPVNTHAVLSPPVVQQLVVLFPAGAAPDVSLAPGQIAARAPGRYGAVSVKAGARLQLRAGTYYLETLALEPQGVLELDERTGPVVLYVSLPFIFRGSAVTNSPGPNLLAVVTGAGTVTIESAFRGTVIAPNAKVVLGVGGGQHTGAFFARDIELQPGVSIAFRASTALPGCSDGNACTGRDVLVGGTCVGQDPLLLGVPESDPTAPKCAGGAAPIGCRAYECATGRATGVWQAAPTCGPTYPTCTSACPTTGCTPAAPRSQDLVSCNCSCADPTGGAPFAVAVNGCGVSATATTCDQLCAHAGDGCGLSSSCSLGTCTRTAGALPTTLARNACRADESLAIPSPADYAATVDATSSRLTITVGSSTTTVPLSGSMGFQVTTPSEGPPRLALTRMILAGSAFDLFGRHLDSPRFDVTNQPAANGTSPAAGRYAVAFPAGTLTGKLSATVDGAPVSFDGFAPTALQTSLDLTTKRIDLSSSGTLPSGDRVSLQIVARPMNLPPLARFAASAGTTVECSQRGGATVALDAGQSTDPEGQPLRYQWFRSTVGAIDGETTLPAGRTTSALLPIGQNAVTVLVSDPQLAAARTTSRITIADTVAPTIQTPTAAVFHAGEGSTSRLVSLTPPVTSDVCDGAPKLRAFTVRIEIDSGTFVRTPIDPANVLLPVGDTLVAWQATDGAGNLTEVTQQVQLLASGSPDDDPPPPQAASCAMPLNPPGPPPVEVDVRVCVVGRIENGVRVGNDLWSGCPNNEGGDANDSCTRANIAHLFTVANELYAPDVHLNFVDWKRIRDSRNPSPGAYGSTPLGGRFAGNQLEMVSDCYSTWGVPTYGSQGANPPDPCTRGIVVVLVRSISSTCGFAPAPTRALMGEDPKCDNSSLSPKTFNPLVFVGAENRPGCGVTPAFTFTHEVGHVLGLAHGNGEDDNCNQLWDQDPWNCDPSEKSVDEGNDNKTLMHPMGSNYLLTELQRDVMRTFALKSVPTIGKWADGCKPVTAPPLPDDTMAPPPPPPPPGGVMPPTTAPASCGCSSGDGTPSPALLVCLGLAGALAARRRRRGDTPSR